MLAEAFKFPEINAILRWKDLFPTFNKIALIAVAATVIGTVMFLLQEQGREGAPKGVRNLAETTVEFVENGIVMQTMEEWLRPDPVPPEAVHLHLPVQPARHHPDPPDAGHGPHGDPDGARDHRVVHLQRRRLQAPGHGVPHQHDLAPRRARRLLKPLVGVIEFISNIIVRPFSLTVRLFANMLAGTSSS